MQKQLAEAIVNEAVDRGIPIGQGGIFKCAERLVQNARKAYDKGVKTDDVMVFIRMADEGLPESPGSSEKTGDETHKDPPKPSKEERHSFMEEVIATTKKGSVTERENLPEPPELDGRPPELPGDITKKSDSEVRQLHSEFFASFARAAFLLSLKENESENAKSIMDYYEDREVSSLESEGEKGTVTSLKAKAAKRQPKIGEWKAKWLAARAEARELRGLKEIYDKACDRLSREMSMRERERGDND